MRKLHNPEGINQMAAHAFVQGQRVTFKDRFGSGAGTIAHIKHTDKGDFIQIEVDGAENRSVRPVSVKAA